MPSSVALALGVALVVFLLHLERRRNRDASPATWIPTLWLLLCGSKPLGRWLDIRAAAPTQEEGSAVDRLVLSALIALALWVLARRRLHWSTVLRANAALVLLFLYLGMSVGWSDFPAVSLKRWIRLCGAIPMALVVLTERAPFQALESVLRRSAYVLIPLSLVMVKYFTVLGVQFSHHEGVLMWVGVASQKNGLGVICSLSAFLVVWSCVRDWMAGTFFANRSFALADGVVLMIALFLLRGYNGVYPATAIGFLLAGVATLLFVSRLEQSLKAVATLIALTVTAVLLSLTFFDSMVQLVTALFQRDVTFTGRTDIWDLVLAVAARSPFVGVGFGGYWYLQDEEISSRVLVHESHSGYLDVYLEVGMIGVALLAVYLAAFFRRALKVVDEMREWGWFGICLLVMALIHNFTESNFLRTSSFFWNSLVFVSVTFARPVWARSAAGTPVQQPVSYAPGRRSIGRVRTPGSAKRLVRR
jgi:O-antigen ligase